MSAAPSPRPGMRHVAIERGAQYPERSIRIKHQAERAERGAAVRNQEIRQGCRKRAGGGAERPDQAVARKHLGPAVVGRALRQHRVLERNQHAEIAAGGVDGADERDERDQDEVLHGRKRKAGGGHQTCAKDQERAQIMARRDPACDQRQQRRSQQRGGCNDADSYGGVAQRRHVGRQNDDGKTVAEATQTPRHIKQRDQRGSGGSPRFSRDIGHSSVPVTARR